MPAVIKSMVVLAMLSTMSIQAKAQAVCGDHADIVARLEEGYGERRAGAGLARSGALVELFAAPSGSWTIVFTQPGGRTCLVATGEHWQSDATDTVPPRKGPGI